MNMLRISLASLLLALALPALAWGPQGHRVAGAMTEALLNASAAAAVREILGEESLAEASTWADRMRSNPSAFWQRKAGPWHYVNLVPGDEHYTPAHAPPQGDAFTALAQFRQELADPATPEARRALALRFALHIIQDLHQPLHAGAREDRGGNDVIVTVDGYRSNLHKLWDSGLLRKIGASDERLQSLLETRYREVLAGAWQEPEPTRWIEESLALSRELYPATAEIDDHYFQRFGPVAERRVAQAAARAAAWLNSLYR